MGVRLPVDEHPVARLGEARVRVGDEVVRGHALHHAPAGRRGNEQETRGVGFGLTLGLTLTRDTICVHIYKYNRVYPG